jgi:hypothetical protein
MQYIIMYEVMRIRRHNDNPSELFITIDRFKELTLFFTIDFQFNLRLPSKF